MSVCLANEKADEALDQFQLLRHVLRNTRANGLQISTGSPPPDELRALRRPPLLRHYLVDSSVQEIVEHNLAWARGERKEPRFKFAYVMLPTECNQRCSGCFTGMDKQRLPEELRGPMYDEAVTDDLCAFLLEHGGEALVYGGGGELFTWAGAFDYIERITRSGLGMVIFTNGTLLSRDDVARLADQDVSLIVSFRDACERNHNAIVRGNGFARTLRALEYALELGMHRDRRVAAEIPVTQLNEDRVLRDFIPAMRSLGVIPMVEEYITVQADDSERRVAHDFIAARRFLEQACAVDYEWGYGWHPHWGQRMLAQPKCERPLYSFTIYPSGDVMDCPSHLARHGSFLRSGIHDVIYSDHFKSYLQGFSLCPCSVFYTYSDADVPASLPEHLTR